MQSRIIFLIQRIFFRDEKHEKKSHRHLFHPWYAGKPLAQQGLNKMMMPSKGKGRSPPALPFGGHKK